ncbi:hypothetical protein L286_11205 [Sphingobium sp. HDIP04]|nr:hypothetical protein L286_11205 [Sphingobium sp. HDIP04]
MFPIFEAALRLARTTWAEVLLRGFHFLEETILALDQEAKRTSLQ